MHEVRCFINTQIRITKDEMTSGLGYQKMQIKCIYVVVYSLIIINQEHLNLGLTNMFFCQIEIVLRGTDFIIKHET